jgi:hypothetical protein
MQEDCERQELLHSTAEYIWLLLILLTISQLEKQRALRCLCCTELSNVILQSIT